MKKKKKKRRQFSLAKYKKTPAHDALTQTHTILY